MLEPVEPCRIVGRAQLTADGPTNPRRRPSDRGVLFPDLPVDLPGTGGLRPIDDSIGELLDLSTIAFLVAVDAATERTVFPTARDISGTDRPMGGDNSSTRRRRTMSRLPPRSEAPAPPSLGFRE